MSNDEDPIFDTIHSLPVLTHSVAIANRTPTANYSQQSKYMPDYGGVLENLHSNLKNNALAKGFPFQPKPQISDLASEENLQSRVTSNECLTVVSYLHSDTENQFSTIRAIEKDLLFDSIEDTVDKTSYNEYLSAKRYSSVPLNDTISGIKLSSSRELLIVKFKLKVKTFKLDRSYQINCEDSIDLPQDEQTVVESLNTLSERAGFYIKDACLNQFNKTIQGVASDNQEHYQVKLYDLVGSTRQPFHTITWAANESDQLSAIENESAIGKPLRGRVVRTFIPSVPALRGIQQLDDVPSHLVNILVTTDHRTALIDPRQDRLGQVYVNKGEIVSMYPIEYLRRTEFSSKNPYQFYSLTNVHVRVFDTRYPGLPLNQVNHMLESSAYDLMDFKVINGKDTNLETLCVSSPDRLSFLTFNQAQENSLINPKSTHLPYHEPVHDDSMKLFGLGVSTNLRKVNLFSILQLSETGDICARTYKPHNEDDAMNDGQVSRAERIVHQNMTDCISSKRQMLTSDDIEEIDALTSEPVFGDMEFINILETITDLEEKITSRRALERFEKMRNELDTM